MTFEQLGGAALMLLFLADVFLTVLYARAGTGLLAPYWNRAIWTTLRAASTLFGRRGSVILSFAGPVIIVALIAFWALGLAVGAALIIRPELGSAIRPSSGDTPTDFVTALLVAGNSLSIVGGGDYSPHTTGTRLLYLLNSLIGASVLSLVLSYLVQVYSGLRERNAFALTIDAMTDGTGDAAQMLARLMPGGDSSEATSELGNLIRPLAAIKEAHHFYPLLFYFRFREPLYSVSRFGFVLLDLMTLIESALDHRRYGTLVGSAPLTGLRRATLMLFDTLDRNFPTASHHPEHAAESWQGRRSYVEASRTLARAGIDAQPDGVERYVAERSEWEPLVDRIARTLGLRSDEVDCRRSQKGAATLTSETVRR